MISTKSRNDERGATLLEFAICSTIFLTVIFTVFEFGRALWVHNALTDAARRGARYAVIHSAADADLVKNVVVYGNPGGGTKPVVDNLTTDNNVTVTYSPQFGVEGGSVSVSITNYQFQFLVPLVSTAIQMPSYRTTLTGECAGLIPADL